MRRGADQQIMSVMDDDTVGIHLELTIAGDSLTGRARDDRGTAREFDGRLGLLAAIDALIAGAVPGLPGRDQSDTTRSLP